LIRNREERDLPPVEFEDNYYRQTTGLTEDHRAEPNL
jgi:hypothetical protein